MSRVAKLKVLITTAFASLIVVMLLIVDVNQAGASTEVFSAAAGRSQDGDPVIGFQKRIEFCEHRDSPALVTACQSQVRKDVKAANLEIYPCSGFSDDAGWKKCLEWLKDKKRTGT